MEIVTYSDKYQKYIKEIEKQSWEASSFLANTIKNNKFKEVFIEGYLFLLIDNESLVGFTTLTIKDCIDNLSIHPIVGFVFINENYRGHFYSKLLIDHANEVAKKDGYNKTFLITDKIGFYEKIGYKYIQNIKTISGGIGRLYKKDL